MSEHKALHMTMRKRPYQTGQIPTPAFAGPKMVDGTADGKIRVVCHGCGARYRVSAEKVAGKRFRAQCKRCDGMIIASPQHTAVTVLPVADSSSTSNQRVISHAQHHLASVDSPVRLTSQEFNQEAEVSAGDAIWHAHVNGENYGPFNVAELEQMLTEQRLVATSLVWCDGMASWEPLQKVPVLTALLAEHEGTQFFAAANAASRQPPVRGAQPVAPIADESLDDVDFDADEAETTKLHQGNGSLFIPAQVSQSQPATPMAAKPIAWTDPVPSAQPAPMVISAALPRTADPIVASASYFPPSAALSAGMLAPSQTLQPARLPDTSTFWTPARIAMGAGLGGGLLVLSIVVVSLLLFGHNRTEDRSATEQSPTPPIEVVIKTAEKPSATRTRDESARSASERQMAFSAQPIERNEQESARASAKSNTGRFRKAATVTSKNRPRALGIQPARNKIADDVLPKTVAADPDALLAAGTGEVASVPAPRTAGPPLDKAQIRDAMSGLRGYVEDCSSRFRVEGLVKLRVTVQSSGTARATVAGGDLQGEPVADCVARGVSSITFPTFKGAAFSFIYPFRLK